MVLGVTFLVCVVSKFRAEVLYVLLLVVGSSASLLSAAGCLSLQICALEVSD